MFTYHQRIYGCLICIVVISFQSSIAPAQHAPDTGSGSPVARFLGAVADLNDALEVETTLAEWTAKEQRILAQERTGLMTDERAASELYGLARAYWERGNWRPGTRDEKEPDFREAVRLLEKSIDAAPDSYAAARSWMLIGNTYVVGILGDNSARAIHPFEQADRVLQDLIAKSDPADQKARDELFEKRGIVTSRLGTANLYTHREEEARRYFQALLDSPDMSRNVKSGFLLNANRELAALAVEREDVEAAREYYTAVDKLIRSGKIDLNSAILLLLESIRGRWPDPFDEERIAAVEALWNEPKYQSSQYVLWAGDELTWAYFFGEPMPRDKFAETSEKFLKQIRPHMQDAPDSPSKFTVLDRHYVRNLLLAIEFANITGEPETVKKLTEEFTRAYEGRDVKISRSFDRSREHTKRVFEIYHRTMPDHFAATLERQRERDRLSEAQPTEAK